MDDLLNGRRIVLGVSGSVAAYRAADLASKLVGAGARVWCVLTPEAARFVGPATFQALTGNPVLVDLFDEPLPGKIAHIALAQESDAVVVAPATANVLARMALGLADDALTSLLLATTVPVVVAPAMNSAMLAHPATAWHVQTLVGRGVRFAGTRSGILACGTEGDGKIAETPTILETVRSALTEVAPTLAGRRVLVTAGPTREPIDPVRFLTNRSSGKMGVALARAAFARGASVTLVHGPLAVPVPPGIDAVRVETTAQMRDACVARFAGTDLVIAAAAPADFAPADVAPHKIKKTGDAALTLSLRPTPDIVAALTAAKSAGQVVAGFAAETEDLLAHAAEKLRRKRLDLIVANDVTAEGAGFEGDTNIVTLLWPDGRSERLDRMSKDAVAGRILDACAVLLDPEATAR